MDSNDDTVDPDYVTNNAALRNLERRDENTVSVETIHRIISEELDKELTVREKQLEEIEEQIAKAQKLLHLVRYVLVTSYYNKKNLEHTTTAEEQMSTVFDSQNRIHPAVKKLIGKHPTLDLFNIHGKRKAAKSSVFGEPSTSQVVEAKKPKIELKAASKTSSVDNNQNCLQSRKKTKHRIVIGNISKYISTAEDDSMTHKWMVYVRGDKNKPDISDIVKKAIFYLHPSYKPHDVVEVNESPFHLSRRGWGEFPLRVQIFFKNSSNKPVDIVHNLKLDKSRTGRQVLGNETLVDVYLRDTSSASISELKTESSDIKIKNEPLTCQESTEIPGSSSTPNVEVKEEPSYSEDSIFDLDLADSSNLEAMFTPLDLDSTYEHSYCNNGMNVSISQDHSYSLPSDSESNSNIAIKKDSNITAILEQGNNRLIFGLGDHYLDEKKKDIVRRDAVIAKKSAPPALPTQTHQSIRILPAAYSKLVNLSNGHSVQVWVLPQGVQHKQKPAARTKQIEPRSVIRHDAPAPSIDYAKYKVTLPKHRFKNLGEALMFLMRRLQLWDHRRSHLDFRCTYPYVAGTKEEFENWNVGKRANSELKSFFQWCRARMLKKILSEETFPSQEKWSTKTYFMYARSHGYCTFVKPGSLFSKYSKDITLISECFSASLALPKNISRGIMDVDLDCDVDVESNGDASKDSTESMRKLDLSDQSDATLNSQCVFIKEAALDMGVVLKPEEIVEGVTMNAAERVILVAVKCFAENLIRRAHHHLVCQTTNKDGCLEVTKDEIQIALKERPEMETIFKFRKMKKERQLFT
nr:unnamed protein product [Callosobruchus chinensis]